jgi:hypothetical protein
MTRTQARGQICSRQAATLRLIRVFGHIAQQTFAKGFNAAMRSFPQLHLLEGDMYIDPALLSPVSALLGALVRGGASLLGAIYTQPRNALKIAFNASHLRSRNGRPFMLSL